MEYLKKNEKYYSPLKHEVSEIHTYQSWIRKENHMTNNQLQLARIKEDTRHNIVSEALTRQDNLARQQLARDAYNTNRALGITNAVFTGIKTPLKVLGTALISRNARNK